MLDLNTLVPTNFPYILVDAHAINDRGQILALGMERTQAHPGGGSEDEPHEDEAQLKVFLLTPTF
jgi:hypothetical protein